VRDPVPAAPVVAEALALAAVRVLAFRFAFDPAFPAFRFADVPALRLVEDAALRLVEDAALRAVPALRFAVVPTFRFVAVAALRAVPALRFAAVVVLAFAVALARLRLLVLGWGLLSGIVSPSLRVRMR